MRATRIGMAITGVLLAGVCIALAVAGATVLVGLDSKGHVAGTVVVAVTVAVLAAGGIYAGYAFVRAAIRMKATTEPNPRRAIRSSIAGLIMTAGFWFLPMPGISLALRIFVCIGLVVIVFAGMAVDLEPPRRKRR